MRRVLLLQRWALKQCPKWSCQGLAVAFLFLCLYILLLEDLFDSESRLKTESLIHDTPLPFTPCSCRITYSPDTLFAPFAHVYGPPLPFCVPTGFYVPPLLYVVFVSLHFFQSYVLSICSLREYIIRYLVEVKLCVHNYWRKKLAGNGKPCCNQQLHDKSYIIKRIANVVYFRKSKR